MLAQCNHLRLRQQFYHQHVGALKRYFIPADAQYSNLKLSAGWQHLGQSVRKRHSPRILRGKSRRPTIKGYFQIDVLSSILYTNTHSESGGGVNLTVAPKAVPAPPRRGVMSAARSGSLPAASLYKKLPDPRVFLNERCNTLSGLPC